jgi:hypothetical protein
MFSKREPSEVETEKTLIKRDVFNEKPTEKEIHMYSQPLSAALPKQVNNLKFKIRLLLRLLLVKYTLNYFLKNVQEL